MTQKMLQSLSLDLPSLPKRRRDDEQIRTKQTPAMKTDAQSLKNCNRGFTSWTVSKKSMVYICEWASYLCHHYMLGPVGRNTSTNYGNTLTPQSSGLASLHNIFAFNISLKQTCSSRFPIRNLISKQSWQATKMSRHEPVWHRNHNGRKRTFWHVHQATIQISLRIRAVWSESSLSHGRNFASLAISKCAEWR